MLDRHPTLVLENCGSGALRSDFGMLSHLQLQSTSDQQDPLLYPMVAVGALVHVLPEQAANWAYPQASMTDEEIAFTMCTGLAGRLYQSGLIDRMSPEQRALVAAGVAAHKATRSTLARSIPRFPTGVPSWNSEWVTVAFDAGADTYVLAWRQRHAAPEVDPRATAPRRCRRHDHAGLPAVGDAAGVEHGSHSDRAHPEGQRQRRLGSHAPAAARLRGAGAETQLGGLAAGDEGGS